MNNELLLNNFYPVIYRREKEREKESDELLYRVWVARYGPQSVASATWLTVQIIENGFNPVAQSTKLKNAKMPKYQSTKILKYQNTKMLKY